MRGQGNIAKWKALLRTGYHANYLIVVTGALYHGNLPSSLGAGGALIARLAGLYVSFNVLLYGGIYTVNALVDLEEDKALKPWRPLATGAVAVPTARALAAALIGAGLATGVALGPSPAVPRLYCAFLATNAVYSFVVRPRYGALLAAHTVSVTAALRLALGAVGVGGDMPPLSALVAAWAAMTSVHISRKRIERGECPVLAEHVVTTAAMMWAFATAWHRDGGFGPWYTFFVLYQVLLRPCAAVLLARVAPVEANLQAAPLSFCGSHELRIEQHVGFGLLPALVDDSYQKLAAFYKTKTQ